MCNIMYETSYQSRFDARYLCLCLFSMSVSLFLLHRLVSFCHILDSDSVHILMIKPTAFPHRLAVRGEREDQAIGRRD